MLMKKREMTNYLKVYEKPEQVSPPDNYVIVANLAGSFYDPRVIIS